LALAANGSNHAAILLGHGDGTFAKPVNYSVALAPISVTVADLNQDGKPDLALVGATATVSILSGNGDGTFQAATYFVAGSGSNQVSVNDFNGDGLPDLAVADEFSNAVSILTNTTP
jgi:hypothetical protein